jgi:hypothetical protein
MRMRARAFNEQRYQMSQPPADDPPKSMEGATAQALARNGGARRSRAFNAFDINWNDVQLVPQLSNMSCWAAAASMVVGWRDQMSIDPSEIARGAGQWAAYQNGLNPSDVPSLAAAWALVMEPPQSYTIEGFRQMIERNGPLWVGASVPGLHAIVVTGVWGDGSPDGTYVRIKDPWGRAPGSTPGNPAPYNPTPGQGSQYDLTFRQFVQEYESAATDFADVDIQILHSGGTGGRVPGTSTAQSFARGYSKAQGGPGAAGVAAAKWAIELIAANSGDNKWTLQRSQGKAYPQGNEALEGTGMYRRKTIRVKSPHHTNFPMGMGPSKFYPETNFLDIDLEFKYNGASIKDVVPMIAEMNDIAGTALNVEGQVIEENGLQPFPGVDIPTPLTAVVRYVLTYHYDFISGDSVARTEVWITGNGEHWERRDWPDLLIE